MIRMRFRTVGEQLLTLSEKARSWLGRGVQIA